MTNDSRLRLCALATVMLAGACEKPSARTRRAYVSNEADGTVSVIDTGAERVVATIHVGTRPRGLRVSPDGARLYVALSGSPRIWPAGEGSALPLAESQRDGISVVDLEKLHLLRRSRAARIRAAVDMIGDSEAGLVEQGDGGGVDRRRHPGHGAHAHPVGHEPRASRQIPEGRFVYVTSEADNKVTVIRIPRMVKTIVDIQCRRATARDRVLAQ